MNTAQSGPFLQFYDHGAGLHLGGLNLSITYTEMVHLLPHSDPSSGSEVRDL